MVTFSVDGVEVSAEAGVSLAAAMINAGIPFLRRSISGEKRSALCGMGICYECRVGIDGELHSRSCMVAVAEGMVVSTDG